MESQVQIQAKSMSFVWKETLLSSFLREMWEEKETRLITLIKLFFTSLYSSNIWPDNKKFMCVEFT